MANNKANRKGVWPRGIQSGGTAPARAAPYHPQNVSRDATTTAGTKMAATRSAAAWMGALASWAASTRRTIWASAALAPTRVARTSSGPPAFTVPPNTASPAFLDTGRGSPVSMASSTWEAPATTTPSAGTRAPGETRRTSPRCTSSAGSSRSDVTPPAPSNSTTVALRGASASRAVTASPVRPLAAASRYLPNKMNVINMAAVSKKSVGTYVARSTWCRAKWWCRTDATE